MIFWENEEPCGVQSWPCCTTGEEGEIKVVDVREVVSEFLIYFPDVMNE